MNNPMYTDRQVALQVAVEFAKTSSHINNSFDVVVVAERFRKFLEEGIVETKDKPGSITVNGAAPMSTTTGGWRPRVGNG
jgi:hypothetical protein